MSQLLDEVARFRAWAQSLGDDRSGEWETEYDGWHRLYDAALGAVASRPFHWWTDDEVGALLYAIARDNENEYLVSELRVRNANLLPDLAEAAITRGEPDAKWQLANELGYLAQAGEREEQLLLRLAMDKHEYVRRRSLGALARLRSPAVEELALATWHRDDPSQLWARMEALSALRIVGSAQLEPLLREAEQDARSDLRAFAARIRRGESLE